MKKQLINIPLFDLEIEVLWGKDIRSIISYLENSEGVCDVKPNTEAFVVDYQDGRIFLCLQETAQSFVILHECIHLVYSIFRRVGINLDDEEVFAYLCEYLYREIIRNV